MEYSFLIIIVGLLGYIFYKERQNEKIIREILAFRISKDAFDFKNLTEGPKKEKRESSEIPEEMPIEEAPADKLLEKLRG